MANGTERFENERSGGSFVMGLLTGTVLGAGLGCSSRPSRDGTPQSAFRSGRHTRNQATEGYKNLANQAT